MIKHIVKIVSALTFPIILTGCLSNSNIQNTDASSLSESTTTNYYVSVDVVSTTDKIEDLTTVEPVNMSPEEKQNELNNRLINSISNQVVVTNIADLQISKDDIYEMTNDFNCSHQNYSFCFKNFSWVGSGEYIDRIEIEYDDPATVSERINYIESETTRIASMIDPSWSDVKKALWINDYIYDRVTYDDDLIYRELDDALKYNKAVCEGIAGMYQEIANKAGLNVTYASSKEINHVWNIVEINGAWYNVDVTMNINTKDRYSAFLLSDNAYIHLAKNPTDIQKEYDCTNSVYDSYFWTESGISSIVEHNGQSYWASGEYIYMCNLSNGITSKIGKINSDHWLMNGSPLANSFVDLSVAKTGFYYNSANAVYHYNVDTGKSTLVKKYDKNEPSIFNIYTDNGKLIIKRYSDFSSNSVYSSDLVDIK